MAKDPNHTNGGGGSSGPPNSTRPLRVIAPAPPAPTPSPLSVHHHLYTVSIRAQSSPVPVPVVYRPPPPPHPPLNFHPHLQPQPHYPHPHPLHYNLHHQSPPPSLPLPPSKILPFPSTTPQVAAAVTAPASSLPDSNGYKDIRDKSRDDTHSIVQDRKIRITDGASLYVLCRSWLRNGTAEESQTRYGDATRSLPKPSPIPIAKKEEGDKTKDIEDEDKESVEHVLPEDLLKRHVKCARKVRARLREERLRRIARYKSRLALLLPPLVEQFRNDLAAGN